MVARTVNCSELKGDLLRKESLDLANGREAMKRGGDLAAVGCEQGFFCNSSRQSRCRNQQHQSGGPAAPKP